jgi:hypothetical protein
MRANAETKMPERTPTDDLSKVERLRIVTMAEAARLAGLSEDSLRRHHRQKILKLSPRRDGMRVEDALMLREKKSA